MKYPNSDGVFFCFKIFYYCKHFSLIVICMESVFIIPL